MALSEQTRASVVLRVRHLGTGPAEEGLWQRYLERTPAATIYHDIAWREIFRTAFGYRANLLVAEDARGEIAGVLPLYEVPSLLGKGRLVSVPFRDRGGVLFDTSEAFLALVARAGELLRERNAASVELKTVVPYPDAPVTAAGLSRQDYWVHSQADLSAIGDGDLLRLLGEKTRNMLRQAERAGLRCSLVDSRAGLADWMSLHNAVQHSLGIPAFPENFFAAIFAILGAKGKAQLFLVRDAAGNPMAGSIGYVEASRFIYAYSASTERGRALRANDMMLASLLQGAIAQKLRWFDFGTDSPLQGGLLFFKRKWFAQQACIPVYRLGRGTPDRDSSGRAYDFVRSAIRALPASPVRLLLAPTLRYLG